MIKGSSIRRKRIEEAARDRSAVLRDVRRRVHRRLLEVLDLNELITDMQEMLRCLVGQDVELLIMLDPALRQLRADQGQIGQLIMNLAVNARDAMLRGGRLTVKTTRVSVPKSPASSAALRNRVICSSVPSASAPIEEMAVAPVALLSV